MATGRDTRGLRGAWRQFHRFDYHEPAPDLAPFVARYWSASWDLRDQRPYRQLIVPYPNVHLVITDGVAMVQGVLREHIYRTLAGCGSVFGVAFRPGCFRPFLGASVATLTGRAIPAEDVFGDVPSGGDAEAFLRERLPELDPMAERVADLVARIAAEPTVTTVAGLADAAHLSVRTLQRLFAEYVGVGPKWVIRRYRLHEITERLAEGADIDWAGIAADLGYADQAHLARDFTAMVGESPTRYAERYPVRRACARSPT